MVEAVGGEEQRHHALVHHAELSVGLWRGGAPGQDLADDQAHGSFAGLVRKVHRPAAAAQALGEELRLRGGPRAVETLEDDEPPGQHAHGLASGGSMPSSARTWRRRRSAARSARSWARARR